MTQLVNESVGQLMNSSVSQSVSKSIGQCLCFDICVSQQPPRAVLLVRLACSYLRLQVGNLQSTARLATYRTSMARLQLLEAAGCQATAEVARTKLVNHGSFAVNTLTLRH